jgi:H+/Cl- antiporter ClcA
MIAPILARRDAAGFWLAVLLTGVGTGLAAAALTGLLEFVQHTVWSGGGVDLLEAASASLLCLGSGAPGGLFTPSLSIGALLGGLLGVPWSYLWPGVPSGLFAVLGAGAFLAATTQGPISAIVLMMELTGQARSSIVPMLLAIAVATLVARTIEPRSIYDARLSDNEVLQRQRQRDRATGSTT